MIDILVVIGEVGMVITSSLVLIFALIYAFGRRVDL